MLLKYCKKTMRFLAFLTVIFFTFNFPVHAAENFIITGKYQDSFQLETNNMHIFEIKDCVPGDSWESEIEIKNLTCKDMEIAVISIESLIEDTLLYDALNLTIMQDNNILYNGSYSETQTPVTGYLTVKGNDSLLLNIFASLPDDSGNVLQGKEMSSLWTFEARHPGYYFGYIPDIDEIVDTPDEPEDILPEQPEDEDIIIPETPVDPATPSEEHVEQNQNEGIKTGVELSSFNSSSIFLLILAIAAIYIGVVFIRKAKVK